MNKSKAAALAEGGAMIALATGLSLITFFKLPQGGSVTPGSMIPLLAFALRRGPAYGVLAGVVYGLIQFMIDPWFLVPVQFILDYPLAFGLLGLAGFLPKHPYWGATLGIFGRFASHLISGVVFFAEVPGLAAWTYSAYYNASYLVPELIFTFVFLMLLWKRIKGIGLPA